MRKAPAVLSALVCGAALSACGSSSSSTPAVGTASTPAPGAPSSSTTSLRPNGEASKSPIRILSDAAAALRHASAYELQGTISTGRQTDRLQLLVSGSGLDMTAGVSGAIYEVRHAAGSFYVRANAAFWEAHFGPRGAALAGRWLRTRPRNGLAELGHFAPATVARCLVEDHGTLSVAGRTTVDGRAAIVLRDAGNLPGTQPGMLAVATAGPPYPLRLVGTGRQRPGGRTDVCNDGHSSTQDGTLLFSHFDAVPAIPVPTGVLSSGGAPTS